VIQETHDRDVARASPEHDPEKWIPVFGKDHAQTKSMIPKSGYRFSEKDHAQTKSMIPKSEYRFSEKIMLSNSRATAVKRDRDEKAANWRRSWHRDKGSIQREERNAE
jgi:hypothetical protein